MKANKHDRAAHSWTRHAMAEIRKYCRVAWQKGFMAGYSGNASIFLPARIVITASGAPKGFLKNSDCLCMDMNGKKLLGRGKPSSESAVHLACYRAVSQCGAILHTHPAALQALEVKLGELNKNNFFNGGLYEEQIWNKKMFFAEARSPGTQELADEAAKVLSQDLTLPCAIWMARHGLVALASNLQDSLCITEELEHLAKVRLMAS